MTANETRQIKLYAAAVETIARQQLASAKQSIRELTAASATEMYTAAELNERAVEMASEMMVEGVVADIVKKMKELAKVK